MSALLAVLAIFLVFPKSVDATIEFEIANLQQESDYYKVDVSLSGLTSSSCLDGVCYLQAVLTATDKNRYFGFTWDGHDNWYEYISSPDPSFIVSNFFSFTPDAEGNWSGNLLLKNNPDHAGYHGEGDYLVKVRRYSGKSKSHSGKSNSLSIHLAEITPTKEPTPTSDDEPSPTDTPASTPTSTSTPAPSVKTSPTPTLSKQPTKHPSKKNTPIPTPEVLSATDHKPHTIFIQESTVSSSHSAKPVPLTTTKNKKNLTLMGTGLLILSGAILFLRNHSY